MSVFTRSISSSTLNEIFGLGKNVCSSDEELIHELRMVQEDNEQCHLLCDEFEDGNIELRDQIEKLEEVNKKLKDQLNTIFPSKTEQTVISKYQVQRTNHLREIKKLKEENKELKTSLQSVKQLRKEHIKFKKENEKLKTSLQFIKTTLTQPVPPS